MTLATFRREQFFQGKFSSSPSLRSNTGACYGVNFKFARVHHSSMYEGPALIMRGASGRTHTL